MIRVEQSPEADYSLGKIGCIQLLAQEETRCLFHHHWVGQKIRILQEWASGSQEG